MGDTDDGAGDGRPDRDDGRGRPASAAGDDPGARIGRWMFAAMWVLLIGLGTLFVQRALDARSAPTVRTGPAGAELELRADLRGHYSVTALVNGEPVEFLVDTGASGIALPGEVAERLGLPRGRSFATRTANGTGRSWTTRLETLSVGPFERRDVPASITPGLDGTVGLLGTSFLREFELLQRDGRLLLREP